MTLVADTSAIYALYDADDYYHESIAQVVKNYLKPLILPITLLVEIDYLLLEYLGDKAELDFIESLNKGSFILEPFLAGDLKRVIEILTQYKSLKLGLADASVMAIAERVNAESILTLDQRDFRAVTSKKGKPFKLLPFDGMLK